MSNHFFYTDISTEHTGVQRVERATEHLQETFSSKRSGTRLVLAALVASVLVASEWITSMAGSQHWVAGWALLWVVAFASIALLAEPAQSLSEGLRALRKKWSEQTQRAEEDDRTWSYALLDARLMADLNRAMSDTAVTFRYPHA
ncbi:MAG: hypothetical protein ACN6O3_02675 [Comamonas sp.]